VLGRIYLPIGFRVCRTTLAARGPARRQRQPRDRWPDVATVRRLARHGSTFRRHRRSLDSGRPSASIQRLGLGPGSRPRIASRDQRHAARADSSRVPLHVQRHQPLAHLRGGLLPLGATRGGPHPTHALIGMSGKDRAPRSCGDVDVELRRLTS